MSKKKLLCLLLSSLILITTTACSNDKKDSSKNQNKYTPGVYTINTNGMKGEMIVDVTFDETSITDVKVTSHSETYGIGYGLDTAPIESLPEKIVETQSLDVDTVTGATLTSKFLIGAVKQAVTEAGGKPENLPQLETIKGEDENYNVDVVVVGGGVAGLSAAIEAAEGGADVLVLEKQGIVGGATTRSGGKLMANGTEFQKSQGIEDSNEEMFSYLKEVGGDLIDDEKLQKFVDNSLDTFTWMVDMGVEVQDVEPIHSSLNPWRVHNTKGGGGMTDGHGGQIIVPMMNKYNEVDGDIIYNVTANELITNENNEVVGVKGTSKDGHTVTVNASTVILATGGYASNKEMMARYSDFSEGYSTQVPAGNLGDGITMAEAVGAQIFDSPGAQTVYVSYTSGVGINEESGLIVSEDGKRFVNEYTYQYHVGDKLSKEKSSLGYYIATSKDPNPTVQYAMTLEDTPSASSIEELAKLVDLDPSTLKATVDRYNELCAKGVDEDFGKPIDKMYPVEGEKYYAIKLNPAVTVTFGGIVTDTESRVLDAENNPIKGLYAAGETAFEGIFGTEYPGCGLAISASSFYGRIAGQNAASNK